LLIKDKWIRKRKDQKRQMHWLFLYFPVISIENPTQKRKSKERERARKREKERDFQEIPSCCGEITYYLTPKNSLTRLSYSKFLSQRISISLS